ncbi:MAG TPA: hypothetical protein VFX35_00765 [Solirubrobacterales bacterium]|nr:hypothetical protein [Solirubrobacterales bacterium]
MVIAIAVVTMATAAASATAIKFGSKLRDAADTGICATTPPSLEATCTETQLMLTPARDAYGGLLAEHHGVITSWQVASGPASPTTAGVRMRLRLLRGGKPVAGAITAYVPLPLSEPGIHRFPARLPIERDGELGLDLSVLGSALGVGSAPIAHSEPGLGEVGEWVPSLAERPAAITNYRRDTELLLSALVEPDRDRDGYGDLSQDRCTYDPRRQSPCLPDRVLPRFEAAYAPRQNFLRTGKASLTVKPSEFSEVFASAQLETPTATWGLRNDSAWVREGASAKLVIKLPPRPRRAGSATLANGGRAYIRCFLTVIDASGNRRHKTIRIIPTGS